MRRLHDSKSARRNPAPGAPGSERRGSTIVVVIALLLALTFLGIVGYTIGTQEHANATYFSESAKSIDFGINRNTLFDWGLRQVILGTRLDERQSALHGGHMSLLPTMFGRNGAPYSGQGVHLGMIGGDIFVDQNYDGQPDADPDTFLELNRAPFAQGMAGVGAVDQTTYPSPDAGYTYWDNNSPFLAYVNNNHIIDANGNARLIVLASFHRPPYLRSMEATGATSPGQWYTDASTQSRVLRPHSEHRTVATDGSGVVTDTKRYVTDPTEASNLGMTHGPVAGNGNPFVFTNINDGVWSGGLGNAGMVSYDVDIDGDGIKEAVYLDLGFPMQTLDNADGTVTNYVPLFAFTIFDADALFNLNAHGNSSGTDSLVDPNTGSPAGYIFTDNNGRPFGIQLVGLGPDGVLGGGDDVFQTRYISRSNQGVGPSEVNLQWGLSAQPADGPLDQHERFFQQYGRDTLANPLSQTELANLEWWWLMSGRPDLDASLAVQNLYPGRYGEVERLSTAFSSAANPIGYPGPGKTYFGIPDPDAFPPNVLAIPEDDNFTFRLGGQFNDPLNSQYRVFPNNMIFPPWEHPLDLRGRGRYTTFGSNGKNRLLRKFGQHKFPSYASYQHNKDLGLYKKLMGPTLLPSYVERYDVDEPEEMILEPSLLRSDLDAIFGAGENAPLHLSPADQAALGLSGRVRSLAPLNFDGTNAEDRRKLFTTITWDLNSYEKSQYTDPTQIAPKFRQWEFNPQFPPSFGGTINTLQDPFRPAVRELLTISPGSTAVSLQRKLSINHICDYDLTGRLRFRPLTPHPVNLPAGRLQTANSGAANFTTAPQRPESIAHSLPAVQLANQEYLARRDRQQLCRDIYVLLYTLSEATNVNVTTAAWPTATLVDSDGDGVDDCPSDLLQMAQFAVNLVDRLDPDSVMTKFEFDINLSDGWQLNDDPFDEDASGNKLAGSTDVSTTRRVVYGVEAQQLTLHEAQVVFAKAIDDGTGTGKADHKATQWDDRQNRDFTYVELENVSPYQVDFANESWQIVVRPKVNKSIPDPSDPAMVVTVVSEERRLTLNGNAPAVGTGTNSRLLIGTAGDQDVTNGQATAPSSHVLIDIDHDPANLPDPNNEADYTRAVPAKSLRPPNTQVLDLIRQPAAYRVNEMQAQKYGDGPQHPTQPSPVPGGAELFVINSTDPLADFITETDDRVFDVEFELRRRMNPNRGTPPSNSDAVENPWIIVDKLTVKMDVFALNSAMANTNDLQKQLTGKNPSDPNTMYDDSFKSKERTEPLASITNGEILHYVNPANQPVFIRNSLGNANPNNLGAIDNYVLYQTHFDRDFGSLGELLNIPLYGPNLLTGLLATNFAQSNPHNVEFNRTSLASVKFLNQGGIPNYWHRLLEFVEVPDRSTRHYDDDAFDSGSNSYRRPPFIVDVESRQFYRRPGRVQLNTLRNPEVLGGLLDDVEVMDSFLTDLLDPNRQWWTDFVRSRDGQDLDPQTAGFSLPGLPVAKPFRDFGYSVGANPQDNLSHTLLRDRPTVPGTKLFEVTGSSDPTLRYRLLEKALNNSTNRSNVFLIFMQVDFFEAAEVTDPTTNKTVVRVGGKLDDSPGYRGFFVVDRSKALELVAPGDLPPKSFVDPVDQNTKFNFSFNESFDFHQLILHRQTIN